jgi:arylsulfatase A-like enzyme
MVAMDFYLSKLVARPQLRRHLGLLLVSIAAALAYGRQSLAQNPPQPNIVVIYADDMGYGDISSFGATDLATPHIDSLAASGVRFTNFYNSSSACTTSRASLLTGSYHSRTGIHTVFGPGSTNGLNPNEITMAEMLNSAGYQSAMVGKWHLGHTDNMMPWHQGFDRFYGIPVSHDYGNGGPNFPQGVPTYSRQPGQPHVVERVVNEFDLDEVALYTQIFSNQAATYIRERDPSRPLFLYVAQPMPHVTLAVTDPFEGSSQRGLYGDVMQELDAGVGTILQALDDEGIRNNTLVVFAADNGPWLQFGNHAGSGGGLREGKRTTFEGGVRTPAAISWPDQIAPGQVVDTPAAIMDLFPTFAALAGAELPTDRVIDGVDIRSLMMDNVDTTYDPNRPLAFYDWDSRSLHAVRSGDWKLVFAHSYETVATAGVDGSRGSYAWVQAEYALYNLVDDPGETTNLIDDHPAVVAQLSAFATAIRADLGDNLTGTPPGPNVRPIGTGTLLPLPPIVIDGDLNGDGNVDINDWQLFRVNLFADTSQLSPQQAYAMGDFDRSGRIDRVDFVLFEAAYDNFNGAGSFAQIGSNAVPEPPATIATVTLSVVVVGLRRRLCAVQTRPSSTAPLAPSRNSVLTQDSHPR